MRSEAQFIANDIAIEISHKTDHPLADVEKKIRVSLEKVCVFFSFSNIKPKTIQFELMYSRQEYNERLKRETKDWMSAHVDEKGVITILDPDALEKYSSHSRNEFPAIVVHELTHIFTRAINSPTLHWVNEGLAQYVARQDSGRAVDPVDSEYFLENHFVTNSGYADFIEHSGYRISFLLVSHILENLGSLAAEKIVLLPGASDCTKQIEELFDAEIGKVKQRLKRGVILDVAHFD